MSELTIRDQHEETQKLLLEITQRIASSTGLEDMLPVIVESSRRALRADGVRLILKADAYGSGALNDDLAKADRALSEWISKHGTLEAADLAANAEVKTLFSGSLKAVMAVPLIAQGVQQGVLTAAYQAAHPFSPDDRTFLAIVAAQAAVAIQNDLAFDTVRQSQQQLAAILASTADPVIVIDAHESILLLNPAAEQALGIVAANVSGHPVGSVIQAEPLLQLLRGEAVETMEWQNEAGQTFAPRVSDVQSDEPGGRGRVLILRDITRYKTLHANQNEFVSNVSHDLRSPLTYMQGYATMLPMVGDLNQKQKDHVDKIVTGIAQMTDLIDKILDAGRLDPETGYYELNREPCDVSKMALDLVSVHSQAAEKKNINLTADIDPGLPILNLDDVMLRRALNNLVDNAIKYTPDNGSVTVAAKVQNGDLVLSVRDTGLGISDENQKRLFERFRRVRRREHQRIKGIGLGLFIVKSVAQRHNGDAWVESKENVGSTFFIRLPMEGVNLLGAEANRINPV